MEEFHQSNPLRNDAFLFFSKGGTMLSRSTLNYMIDKYAIISHEKSSLIPEKITPPHVSSYITSKNEHFQRKSKYTQNVGILLVVPKTVGSNPISPPEEQALSRDWKCFFRCFPTFFLRYFAIPAKSGTNKGNNKSAK